MRAMARTKFTIFNQLTYNYIKNNGAILFLQKYVVSVKKIMEKIFGKKILKKNISKQKYS